jgi:Ser/Thr protein kinase RdoA (MazF antagonist)
VANVSGELVTKFGARYCTLTRWVPGRRRFRATGPGARVLHRVGQIMAELHEHGGAFKPPRGFVCPRWDYDGLFGRSSPWRPPRTVRRDPGSRAIMQDTRRVMTRLGCSSKVFGLIHGDLIQANYVVDGDAVYPIDFADFGRGYYLYDMAVTLLMLKPFDAGDVQRRAFMAGYRSVRPLSIEQESLLDTFIAARALVLARWILGAAHPTPADVRWADKTLRSLRARPR